MSVKKVVKQTLWLAMAWTMVLPCANAEDWPMWRHDSSRTAITGEQLDDTNLKLHWKRQYAAPQPAWDNQQEESCYGGPGQSVLQKLSFDTSYQPVVMGDVMYVGSMNNDSLTAINLNTGEELWKFFTNGPIRFAPVAMDGKIYVGSDDGYLYCLNESGKLLWKKQGGPTSRKVLGNDRMISAWPVRGAAVVPTNIENFPNPSYVEWLNGKYEPGVENYRIADGSNDSEEEISNGSIDLGSSDLEIGREHNDQNDYQTIGLRFSNDYYALKNGTPVTSANIQFTVDETDEKKGGTQPLRVRIYGEKTGSSQEFTSSSKDITGRDKTTAYVDWIIPSWTEEGAAGEDQKTPNLSAIINEIMTSSDWVQGSPITFIIERVEGDGIRCAESFDGDDNGAVLTIDSEALVASNHARPEQFSDINPAYTAWQEALSSPEAEAYKINSTMDDQEENPSGGLYNDSSDLELCHDGDVQVIGMRFTNDFYALAQNGTVSNAYVQFTVDETKGGTEDLQVKITGDLSGDSASIEGTYGISGRTRTTAEVIWDIPSWEKVGDAGSAQQTPDLSAIINEIVACEGWGEGSAITLIVEYVEGSGIRCAESKDGNGVGPQLVMATTTELVARTDNAPEQYISYEFADLNTMYFGAGIYPFEGTFTYALDKDTGDVKWLNDKDYMYFANNPHGGSEGYNGNGPQGYLTTAKDGKLLVPNGRNRPACLSRDDGSLLFHMLPRSNGVSKGDGGYFVSSLGDYFYTNRNSGLKAYNLSNGSGAGSTENDLMDEDHLLIVAGDTEFSAGYVFGYIESLHSGYDDSVFKVSGGEFSYDGLEARPTGLLAANGHLIVTTRDGSIYCFGEGEPKHGVKTYDYIPEKEYNCKNKYNRKNKWLQVLDKQNKAQAEKIIAAAGYQEGQKGICIVDGLSNGKLTEALAVVSDLTVVAFETNARKVDRIRRNLDAKGLYGRKVHIIEEDFTAADVPSYCAHILTSERTLHGLNVPKNMKEAYRVLRPYGGAVVAKSVVSTRVIKKIAGKTLDENDNYEVSRSGQYKKLTKVGKLPGADDWTHQHANAQQTTFSKDDLVKLPMGILWYGGSADNTNDKILPRHGHGPSPQVVGGRYFIEGLDILRCVDVYTGRVLWEKEITNLGQFSNYTDHQAGQLSLGDNYITTEDKVYVLGTHEDNDWPTELLVLNAATGETEKTVTLPANEGFGSIAVYDDYLIATGTPLIQDDHGYANDGTPFPEGSGWIYQDSDPKLGVGGMGTWNGSTSRTIHVLDRNTGEHKWTTTAAYGFHNCSIVAGNGKLFALDRINWDDTSIEERLKMGDDGKPHKSSGSAPKTGYDRSLKEAKLTAFNIGNGTEIWSKTQGEDGAELFGSWLAYSEEYDTLVECERSSRDYYYTDGGRNMTAWQGANGTELWSNMDKNYLGGPVVLNGDMIITQSGNDMGAINLTTGEDYKVPSGLTGEQVDFAGFKRYGCGTMVASKNVMFFRSGNAGYYDLNTFSGTGNFGGFKSGCTINLMPANGLMVAPEYSRTCGCSYQLQTSCALIHREDVEQWSCNKNLGEQYDGGRLANVGLNFGAIGDRVDAENVLWMEYPFGEQAMGYDYQIPVNVAVTGADVSYFRHHSLTVQGDLNWVAASGVMGATAITLDVGGDGEDKAYDVTLYFVEQETGVQAGDRVFSVTVNGNDTGDIDVAAEAGYMTTMTRTIENVLVGEQLQITLNPVAGQPILSGVSLKLKSDIQVASN